MAPNAKYSSEMNRDIRDISPSEGELRKEEMRRKAASHQRRNTREMIKEQA
jgi:hypothetical protein